jgi:hypothetical protein
LPIGKSVGKLHNGDQCQAPGGFCWLSGVRKQVREGFILINRAQFISHSHKRAAFRKGSMGNTGGFFWDCIDPLWLE